MTEKTTSTFGLPRRGTCGRAALILVCTLFAGSCNEGTRATRSSSFLVIEQFQASSGASPTTFNNTLSSDVVTNVKVSGSDAVSPTVFEDFGRVIMRLGFKDPGIPSNPSTPTSANFITVTHYRVDYRRTDGRNTPGVDVPYPFEGGLTFSVLDIGSGTFTLVRGQSKLEPPLLALRNGGGAVLIGTIADVTFFGHDQTGSSVTTKASMFINFADFGDPQ
jgi:hypothetical protein